MPVDKRGRTSAGLLLYRYGPDRLEVLLAHPGGPFHARSDLGLDDPEGRGRSRRGADRRRPTRVRRGDRQRRAAREPIDLGEIFQKSGKRVVAWALEGDLDPAQAQSNTFELDWPPRSGRRTTFPEIDRVAWYDVPEARRRIKPAQVPFLDRLAAALTDAGGSAAESPDAGGSAAADLGPRRAGRREPRGRGLDRREPTVAEP